MNISRASTSNCSAIDTLQDKTIIFVSHIKNGVVARKTSYNLPKIQGGIPSLKQVALEAFIKGNEHELNQLNGDIEALMNTNLAQLKPGVAIDTLFVNPTVHQVAEALFFHSTLKGFGRILGSPEFNIVSLSEYQIKTPLCTEPLKFTGYAKRNIRFSTIFTPFNEKPDKLLEYKKINPNVNLYIREVTCVLDNITRLPIYYPTGNGKIIEKLSDGSIRETEGTWGPKDPTNPQVLWTLTGIGKIIEKKPNGTIIESEGIWGPKDLTNPLNPWGLWTLTGNGKKIEKKTNGTIIESEGTWGPMDLTSPLSPWTLTGNGKIIEKSPDGTIREMKGTWGPADLTNPRSPWCLSGNGKITEKLPDETIIEREGFWGPKEPTNPHGQWHETGNGKIIEKLPDGTIREMEGIWGPKDPTNPQGPWHITGIGKIIETNPDGTIREMEGTWGPADPTNPQGPWVLIDPITC